MSSSAEEPLEAEPITKTQAALMVRCPRCKADPGKACTRTIRQYDWSRPYTYDMHRPHADRYRKVAEDDKLRRAKELGITRPEMDRRARLRTLPSETALAREALLAFDTAEREQLREWLREFSSVLTHKETP